MNGSYAYTPGIWPPLAAALCVAMLGLYTWRRRDVPAGKPFLAASAFGSLLLLGIALEAAAITPAGKVAWYQWQYALQLLAVTAGTCIALEYSYPRRWLTRRNLVLLAAPPLLAILLINLAPQLVWQRLWVGLDGTVATTYTPLGVVLSAYSWGLLLVNADAFLWLFAHSPQHRWPVALMLCGQAAGRVFILADVAGMPPPLGIDLAVLAVLAPWTAYAIALLGFHILDPLPPARQTALAQMSEGMIVLDARQRIASVNPAASAMLEISAADARGRLLGEFLPVSPELACWCSAAWSGQGGKLPSEIGHGEHWYAVAHSPLSDFRGQPVGHLLMLRDVTEEKRARIQILEQERALATLRERERLAHELHDGVAQLLAAAHLQVNTAKLLAARGQGAQLEACLDGLEETTLQAETDVREYLLGVKSTAAGAHPLFLTLREYLGQFTRSCGIPVELSVPAELEAKGLDPEVEVQLVRIIQEALTNVRKHAAILTAGPGIREQAGVQESCRARVIFTLAAGEVQVVIADDGCGFDPAAGSRAGSKYGLRSMEERAKAVGGSVAVTARPGQGTQVTVLAPCANGSGRAAATTCRHSAQNTIPHRTNEVS